MDSDCCRIIIRELTVCTLSQFTRNIRWWYWIVKWITSILNTAVMSKINLNCKLFIWIIWSFNKFLYLQVFEFNRIYKFHGRIIFTDCCILGLIICCALPVFIAVFIFFFNWICRTDRQALYRKRTWIELYICFPITKLDSWHRHIVCPNYIFTALDIKCIWDRITIRTV